jgi:hypothetical protein
LSLFQGPEFCLAVKTTNINPVYIFSSWELEVDCQGGKPFVVNSDNGSLIRLYWDPTGGNTCGQGSPPLRDTQGHNWMDLAYQPAGQQFTQTGIPIDVDNFGPIVPLKSALTHAPLGFISYNALPNGSGTDRGCGILYWRQVASLPPLLPTFTPTTTPTRTATPSPTPSPTPTRTPRPTPTPWPTYTPTDTPVPWPWVRREAKPDLSWATRVPKPRPVIKHQPTATPTPLSLPASRTRMRPAVKRQVPALILRPTPTWVWRPTKTATPRPAAENPPARIATPIRSPAAAPVWLSLLDKAQIIEFSDAPANIYVGFADGPGIYRLQIVDDQGKLLQVIYNQRVVAQADAWVGWDGRDAQGRDAPPGQYFVIIYKDGKALKSLSVVRISKSR